MRQTDLLPGCGIEAPGPVSRLFLAAGVYSVRAAADRIHTLPYGRTSQSADYLSVLEEDRGTCSTKHALMAALAGEQDIPLKLRVGMFEMNAANTPAIAETLLRNGLNRLPEAHCYLDLDGTASI